ncbi:EF-hand domain-containing protein [Rhizobium lusitanum]|jgi:hypothetical protein|uniref:EF hand n=1 Tax=Rhizobium lusitanum TaxID=293958 RepID=A0A1C3X5R7_9HYPH|nr:EF-hand domain-containing protein [Rhizobium lusitanum]SCB47535.1 EF hand [Rhizobium lusitanum]
MSQPKLPTIIALAAFLTVGGIGVATAQSKAPDQDRWGRSAMMPDEMENADMMDRSAAPCGIAEGMPMGKMRGHMMKIMFAIADTNGDGALSFDEVTAIHKRIFDLIDANKDGKVTPEEIQAFMQGQ